MVTESTKSRCPTVEGGTIGNLADFVPQARPITTRETARNGNSHMAPKKKAAPRLCGCRLLYPKSTPRPPRPAPIRELGAQHTADVWKIADHAAMIQNEHKLYADAWERLTAMTAERDAALARAEANEAAAAWVREHGRVLLDECGVDLPVWDEFRALLEKGGSDDPA